MPGGVLIGTGGGARVSAGGGVKATNASGACPDCSCGGLGPCCTASFPCEITTATTARQFRTWWNVTASGRRSVRPVNPQTTPPAPSCVGGQFSGTYSGVNVFTPLTLAGTGANNTAELGSGPCYVDRVVQDQTLFAEIGTVTGSIGIGGENGSYARQLVRTQGGLSGGGWAFQPGPSDVNPSKELTLRWDIGAGSFQVIGGGYKESNRAVIGIEIRLLNGIATLRAFGGPDAAGILPASFGSAVPFLVKEGNCILGVGATFTLTFQDSCINGNTFQSESLGPLVISGSVATALCGLGVGCTNPGSVCASATVPGAPGGGGGGAGTLEDQLDDALFS
jgi:hypothetical protein